MATTKKRVNITLDKGLDKLLARVAKRDNVPQATKALHLLRTALAIEEDRAWEALADDAIKSTTKFHSHEDVWS